MNFPITGAPELEAARERLCEHARYYGYVSSYADRFMQIYGIPHAQISDYPYPGDYGIDWPRDIIIETDHRLGVIIVKMAFPTRVIGVSRKIPPRPRKPKPQRRIWGVLVRIR